MAGVVKQDGLIHREAAEVPLEEDDSRVLQIMLNIVHGLHTKVPRAMEEHTFCEAVALVDKYQFHEIAEVFTDMWFARLESTLPRGPRADLASRIYICYSLGRPVVFNAMTKIAILDTNCVFQQVQEARIPCWIIGKFSIQDCASKY